jgi:outer membrane biosynthesis protein TonB
MRYRCRAQWIRPGAAEVPIAVPLVVGVCVVAAAVGVGFLLRKSPDDKPQAKATATQPETKPKPPSMSALPVPRPSAVPNQPTVTPTPQPQPTPQPAPPIKTGPPLNAKQGFEIGNLAPDIRGDDLDGQTFKLSDYRGKVIVLDFWGHW